MKQLRRKHNLHFCKGRWSGGWIIRAKCNYKISGFATFGTTCNKLTRTLKLNQKVHILAGNQLYDPLDVDVKKHSPIFAYRQCQGLPRTIAYIHTYISNHTKHYQVPSCCQKHLTFFIFPIGEKIQ